ncbi:MAG TPA: SPASM domain-containing protein, partial [Candidatus Aminicenantes bacterium]|nr:SPASM domain-containing protein [Candidatus Aminicenantes bacterium]
SWPLDSLFVDVDGTLSFCCLFTKPLGNLHAASADRLLSLPKAERWRAEFLRGNRSKCGLPCRGKSS